MTDPCDLVTLRPPRTERLETLSAAECFRLLGEVDTARLAWVDGERARVVPVTIAMADGAVMFWTAPGRKLTAARAGRVFTFEVERLEPALHLGWSIEAVGRPSVVDDPAVLEGLHRRGLRPWLDIEHAVLVAVRIDEVTGRRFPERAASVERWWFDPTED